VDEYFAKTGGGRCLDFREAAEAVAKGGLKLFLGLNATCQNWAADGLSCSIVLDENPLADFVELPEQYRRARRPRPSRAHPPPPPAASPTVTCSAAAYAARWSKPPGG